MTAAQRPAVAYALTKYLQSSQTFVEGEIVHLRALGATVQVVALERRHVDRGADPDTTYLDTSTSSWRTLLDHMACVTARPLGYARFLRRVRALRSELGWRPEQLPWWRLPGAARRLRRAHVGIVHAHFGWSGASAAACLGALLGIPWSMTLHAKDIFVKQHNLEWKLANADLIVTVCDYNRRWLGEQLPDVGDPVVLTCGVRLPVDQPERRSTGADIVTVGRLIPKKGIDAAIGAVAVLQERGRSARLDVVGDGPQSDELRALSERLGVSGLVRFRGELPHEQALEQIAAGSVFCLPCRTGPDGDRDAVPTVIVEAMARGVPIVSTRRFGIPELVDDSCGRLVDTADPAQLADALEELLADAELRGRLGRGGVERVRERFTVEGQVARLAELLQATALAGRR